MPSNLVVLSSKGFDGGIEVPVEGRLLGECICLERFRGLGYKSVRDDIGAALESLHVSLHSSLEGPEGRGLCNDSVSRLLDDRLQLPDGCDDLLSLVLRDLRMLDAARVVSLMTDHTGVGSAVTSSAAFLIEVSRGVSA